jgi:putative ubiquitin-RnfH superfamily antitoxin RatB of RatAB toxin-antitoxin module
MISVQTVLQVASGTDLVRQQHRTPSGTTIRELLQRAGLQETIAGIESGMLGLSCHGKRAWLDDRLVDGDRVEMIQPIRADAKAARVQRVATDRARRRARPGAGE